MTTNNVITQLNIKNNNGNNTYYIGPELKYVGSLTASNSHNLEEQMLMGVDRYIESYYDSVHNTQVEVIEFRRAGDTKYYSLEKVIYDNNVIVDSVIEQDTLYYTDPDNGGKKPISVKKIRKVIESGVPHIIETIMEPTT